MHCWALVLENIIIREKKCIKCKFKLVKLFMD